MSASERRKGLAGELEVATAYREHGFQWRGLEGSGDALAVGHGATHHVEVKRQEVARPWLWQAQALAEAPSGALPVVAFRRSRSPWWAMSPLAAWLGVLAHADPSTVTVVEAAVRLNAVPLADADALMAGLRELDDALMGRARELAGNGGGA